MTMKTTPSLDVVLVNPASRAQVYQSLGSSLAAIENPVWAGLMATFCRGQGLSVGLVDAEADELSSSDTAQRVADLNPALTVVVAYGHQPSASTQIMESAGVLCRALKDHSPERPVLLVGGHVAALPERTLLEEVADYVAAGEGLHTIVDLAKQIKSGDLDLPKVRGLWYRDGSHVRSNLAAPLVRELDSDMPGIAWDLLPMPKYRAHNWHCFGRLERQPYAAIYTTLGCPYHCSFCCIQAPFKDGERAAGLKESVNSYRYWDVASVIAEIDVLVERFGVRNIKIADEMFVLNRKHVLGLCDAIIERGYDLNIWAYARVDTVKEGMLEKLKQAGFHWLAFGIEAASESVRDDVDKRFSQEEVYDTIARVKDAGINVIGNYIFGLPEDDFASMQATLDLASDLNCEMANFYAAMAYPGSPLYLQATASGWKLPDRWTGYSQHAVDSQPLPTRHLSAAQVLEFRDGAFLRYFSHPRYLAMIERQFGPATVQHVREMSSHKLRRRLLETTHQAA
jgi:radical SAM superfamily enzyme YgiQ (UPF0313 family)